MAAIEKKILFGCSVQSINVQFGLNQNPSVITVSVVQEPGQTFSLKEGDIRKTSVIELGALDFKGIIQSWNKVEKSISGRDKFTIRITDTRTVLDAAQILLHAPTGKSFGSNVIPVTPESSRDITDGIRFEKIKADIVDKTIFFGQNKFEVDMSEIELPPRGTDIEYRIKGSAMSFLELIQQIMRDHSLDWYVETNQTNQIIVKTLDRETAGINIDQITAGRNVTKLIVGKENRDDFNKTVLLGANKQTLVEQPGETWTQYWGVNEEGQPFSQPQFNLVNHEGVVETVITTEEEIEKAINNKLDEEEVGEEKLDALKSYGNNFWGRRFYTELDDSFFDANDNPWISVVNAGVWENSSPQRPDDLLKDSIYKFGTDDGRWTCFVKIPDPRRRIENNIEYKWDTSVLVSPNIFLSKDNNWYMKARAEIINKILVITVSTPLVVSRIENQGLDPKPDLGLENFPEGSPFSFADIVGEIITQTRFTSIDKAWVPIRDNRKNYGPFSNEIKGLIGKTQVLIDSALNPWQFGFRDITISEANSNMEKFAKAKLASISTQNLEIDTAEFEIVGLPILNIGDAVAQGSNITSLQIIYDINGVKTSYKANLFTGELGRFQKLYQDLVDQLRRQAQLRNNTLYPQQNFFILDKELQALRNSLPEELQDSDSSKDLESLARNQRVIGRIINKDNDGPYYDLKPMKWIADIFGKLTLQDDPTVLGNYNNVINMSENINHPGRLPIGMDIELKIESKNSLGVPSYYMEVAPEGPKSFAAIINNTTSSIEPRYNISPILDNISNLRLLPSEISALNNVLNLGEPQNSQGFLQPNTQVNIQWNDNGDGTFTPFMEQQVNLFKPPQESLI